VTASVRVAGPDDRSTVVGLRRAWAEEQAGDAVTGRPTKWGYIANVYVDEKHRDVGLGRLLLDAASSYAEEHRFARLVLSPSDRSVSFYTRAGFVPATSLLVKPLA
jgi:ribosomal protein S18 acetylase RimI-like enzyme